MKPKVSVIMAVYNAGPYLQPAVMSVLNQSYTNFELILVDDGATDGSGQICDVLATKDNRIQVCHQQNMGICDARNKGLSLAQGELIAFCDHDDIYLNNYLETAVKALNDDSNIDLVKFGYVTEYISNNLKYSVHSESKTEQYTLEEVACEYSTLNQCVKALWNGIYKRSIIEEGNIAFDTFYRSGVEDYDFNLKYLPYCRKISTISDELFIHFMRNGQSADTKFSINKLESWERVSAIEFSFINKYCDTNNVIEQQLISCQVKYITSIMSCLMGQNCYWALKDKVDYLAKLRSGGIFTRLSIKYAIKNKTVGLMQKVLILLFAQKCYIGVIIYMSVKIRMGSYLKRLQGWKYHENDL